LAIKNYRSLKALQPLGKDVYQNIIDCHFAKKSRTGKILDVLEEAIVKHPDHVPFIIRESRILIRLERYEAAESRLQTVIRRNPEAYDLRLFRADLFDIVFRKAYEEGLPDKSEAYFDRASEDYEIFLDALPDHFAANYNYAVMINERANRFYVKANLLSNEEFEISGVETQEEGHKWTRKALPFMEKALSLKPGDESAIEALKAFYQRLKLDEKLALLDNR
jgi:tetratricopeptide (TPR) repeat protein